eukprot:3935636-Pyramimonas_sp.AAC.2
MWILRATVWILRATTWQVSPERLAARGVPVVRAVQGPGEFIITFPRSFHGGFNSGLNCAEAVNFAPIDWLPWGDLALRNYIQERRAPTHSQVPPAPLFHRNTVPPIPRPPRLYNALWDVPPIPRPP